MRRELLSPRGVEKLSWGLVAGLLGIWVLAVTCFTPVRTWDDRYYRRHVDAEVLSTTPARALAAVLLPETRTLNGERTRGYQNFLVLVSTLLPPEARERGLRWLNLFFGSLVAVLLFDIARACLKERFAAAWVVASFLALPIVFGMSRWIYTENHSILALIAFAWVPLALSRLPAVRPGHWTRERGRELAKIAGLAWAVGVLSSTRELIIPSFASVAVLGPLFLIRKKRQLEALAFVLILAPYVWAMSQVLPTVLESAFKKAQMDLWWNPVPYWFYEFSRTAVGGGGWSFLAILGWVALSRVRASKPWKKSTSEPARTALLLAGAQSALFVWYAAMFAWSQVHIIRGGIPFLVWGTLALLFWIGASKPTAVTALTRPGLLQALAGSLALALGWQSYQLLFAYDGGASYGLHPFRIKHEVYNHPLALRPMQDEGDLHVIPLRAKDLRYWEITKDLPER